MIVRLKETYKFFIVLICLFVGFSTSAQVKILRGVIKDVHSLEPVPFASIEFKKTSFGKLSDSAGAFEFRFNEWPTDTVLITYVGYQDFLLAIDSNLVKNAKGNVIDITIQLERGKYAAEVVVRRTIDRGYLMWKRIVKRKPFNDRYRFDNFGYELYNKLEIDLKNLKPKRIENIPLLNLKKFNFIFNNIDTTEDGNPYLPIYLTEAISDYYYQRSPKRRREVFKGTKTLGVNNESVSKLLGGMDQNINFYNNFIPVMDKKFISPISDNGDNYYRYKVLDTQVVAGRRLIHFTFTAKRKGENTFEGDCWIHDTTFAVQKMNLRLSKDANINYVDKLSLIQEYKLINDSTWFLSRDKFVVDLSALGEKSLSAIG
ncbi:MAG: carboxypeptidase-like regulatory domain-containing protein, partial [Chitinophagaceae bacterium]